MADDWRGSIFPQGERLKMTVKVDGKWKQLKTPYRVGQEVDAEALLVRTRELILAGEDLGIGPDPTISDYAKKWLKRRMTSVSSWRDDQSRLDTHILPALGSLRMTDTKARHVAEMITKVRGADLAPRTVRNIYTVVKAMFRDAQIDGLVEHQPCVLTHHQLGKIRDKNHEWRGNAQFSKEQLLMLLWDARVPQDRRVLYGLGSLGRLRHGEGAGLRWRHLLAMKPLGRIVVATSYDNGTTKTRNERWMPVQPMLAALLAEWKLSGWPREFGRRPEPNDLVVPHTRPKNRGPRVKFGGMRSDHDSWKRLKIDCDALGIPRRRVHDLCRTGITLYREAGADKEKLQLCTHGKQAGDVMEAYTTFGWASLCEEISKLRLVRPVVRASGNGPKGRDK